MGGFAWALAAFVAIHVGVSATAVYRHFPDKQALLHALADVGGDRMASAFERFIATRGDLGGIVSAGGSGGTALATAAKLAQQPPAAMRLTKALIKRSFAEAVQQALDAENKAFGARMRSPEAREAISAFFDKRKPDFSRFS